MKKKGEHGEYGYMPDGRPNARRKIKVEPGERLHITVLTRGMGEKQGEVVLSYFVPGVLTVDWEPRVHID